MNQPESTETKEPSQVPACVGREELYALVWAEPMLKVAARFSVSSSYMARICTLMNVPRPERGYWAKLAVGKHSPKPELRETRPGDQVLWNRSDVPIPRRALPRPPTTRPRRKPEAVNRQPEVHLLIQAARAHFEVGRTSYDSQYLKPAKRLLVDLVVTKTALDKALGFANALFRELEARDCRVVHAPHGEYMRRAKVDEHEAPQKGRTNDYDYHRLWSPARITVAYVGTVAIGLTVIELSEVAEARYVKGQYVRVDGQAPIKRRGYPVDDGWTTKRDFPTGRLCLQAYCPDARGEWTKQWREPSERDLKTQIPSIIRELVNAAPLIADLIKEGERKAELQRQEWEEERRESERKLAEERAAKARRDSRDELLQIIDAWAQAKGIEQFFADVEARLDCMAEEQREVTKIRLRRAREFVGGVDAMQRFSTWKTPAERV
jgi:hypothetical protein